MPPRKSKASKRYPARKRVAKRVNRKRSTEYASCSETYEFADLSSNLAYYDYATSLARYTRAPKIAQGYQEFRISRVTWEFVPLFDTFANNGLPSTSTIPELYYMVDRVGTMKNFTTAQQLEQAGAKPHRLDDKIKRVSIRPTVLMGALDLNNASNPYANPKTSPWLSTSKTNDNVGSWSASSIDHLGLAWIIQTSTPSATMPYAVRQKVHFQFRKPNVQITVTEGDVPAVQAPAKVLKGSE